MTENMDDTDQNDEEAHFSYEVLQKEAEEVKLPSSLWAMHKHPKGKFVAFSRLCSARVGRLVSDKAVVFVEGLVPSVFFREVKLKLPNGLQAQPLESLEEVSTYLYKIHRLAFCIGTGLKDPTRSIKCRIYVDMPSAVKQCTACALICQTVISGGEQLPIASVYR